MSDLRLRQPGRPLWRIAVWHAMQTLCFFVMWLGYHYRAWGVRRIPAKGPVLFVANHQSFFDPVLIGVGAHKRNFFALGRSTLYDTKFTAIMGDLTNSIPVEQGAGDVKAIKKCVEVLKQDQALLIFPEGARTLDGKIHRFETGTMLIIKRAKPMVVPVAVDGLYDVWPRSRKLPRLRGRAGVMFGQPIPAQTLIDMPAAEAMSLLRERVLEMREQIDNRLGLEPIASDADPKPAR